MGLIILLLLLLAPPAAAQFTELATNDDGNVLYFTSALSLKNVAAPLSSEVRIYRLDSSGVSLFAQRDPARFSGLFGFTGEGVGGTQVSGDGATVGYTARNICSQTAPCDSSSLLQALAVVQSPAAAELGPGTLMMSRNGRWALLVPAGLRPASMTLVDLQSGQRRSIPVGPPPGATSNLVASDGTVLGMMSGPNSGSQFGLWREGEFTPILGLRGAVRPSALSDNAQKLIYEYVDPMSGGPLSQSIVARDLATGEDTVLFHPDPGVLPLFLSISNDGRWVLFYLVGPHGGDAYVADTSSGQSWLTPLDDSELATAGTITGSGNAAFVVTTKGRLVKFDLVNGEPGQLNVVVPDTPYHGALFGPRFSPGSMVRLVGSFPVGYGAPQAFISGVSVPVLSTSANEIRIQVPWEQAVAVSVPFRLAIPGDTPFEYNELVTVYSLAAAFLPADPGVKSLLGLKFMNGDLSAPVNTNPGPGDVVIAYMTGLGPVHGTIETGTPAPADPKIPIVSGLSCRFLPQPDDAETLSAGLAPGEIGIYQVAFRMPPGAGQPIRGISCGIAGPGGSEGFSISGFPLP